MRVIGRSRIGKPNGPGWHDTTRRCRHRRSCLEVNVCLPVFDPCYGLQLPLVRHRHAYSPWPWCVAALCTSANEKLFCDVLIGTPRAKESECTAYGINFRQDFGHAQQRHPEHVHWEERAKVRPSICQKSKKVAVWNCHSDEPFVR